MWFWRHVAARITGAVFSGMIAAKGAGHVEPLLARIADDPAVPEPARAMFASQRLPRRRAVPPDPPENLSALPVPPDRIGWQRRLPLERE